jgi:hypothetical protein
MILPAFAAPRVWVISESNLPFHRRGVLKNRQSGAFINITIASKPEKRACPAATFHIVACSRRMPATFSQHASRSLGAILYIFQNNRTRLARILLVNGAFLS